MLPNHCFRSLFIYQLAHIPSLKVIDIILMALLTYREMNQEAQKVRIAPLALVTVHQALVTLHQALVTVHQALVTVHQALVTVLLDHLIVQVHKNML